VPIATDGSRTARNCAETLGHPANVSGTAVRNRGPTPSDFFPKKISPTACRRSGGSDKLTRVGRVRGRPRAQRRGRRRSRDRRLQPARRSDRARCRTHSNAVCHRLVRRAVDERRSALKRRSGRRRLDRSGRRPALADDAELERNPHERGADRKSVHCRQKVTVSARAGMSQKGG
jgi:hypothetical protein